MRRLLIPLMMISLTVGLLAGVHATLAQDEGGSDDGGHDSFDQKCLACHGNSTESTTFENGDSLSVAVDVTLLDDSVHGLSNPQAGLSCYDCHGEYTFPHEATYASAREFRLELTQACQYCHTYEGGLQQDSVHANAMAAGDENAAVCVDCHGSHNVGHPADPRSRIPQTCGQCHTEIYAQYKESVHGAALLDDANPDVPSCIDCHGVHNIGDPMTNLFRLRSPNLCAKCHADDALMEKYGISTNVFNSYVSDFHGKTVELFLQEAPGAAVNKAVCYDCHGVHDILPPDDPRSSVAPANLLHTCQRCHPDASQGFDTAWTKHYAPSRDKFPVVYYVDLFYKLFIPGILGFFGVVMVPDILRRIVNAARGGGHDEHETSAGAADDASEE